MLAFGDREYGDGSTPLHMTQQYHLASLATRLSSTGISHHSLLPNTPSTGLSTVKSSPCPGIAPQSLNSSSQLLCLPGDQCSCMYGCSKDYLILIPFRLPQISCFTLSLKYFSSDSGKCPDVGIGPLLQFPDQPRAGPVLLTLLFFPLVLLSYRVLWSSIYYFPWSGPPVRSQLLFCMNCRVWSCVPDVSVERDGLHIRLLLCHLVSQDSNTF